MSDILLKQYSELLKLHLIHSHLLRTAIRKAYFKSLTIKCKTCFYTKTLFIMYGDCSLPDRTYVSWALVLQFLLRVLASNSEFSSA